MCYFLYKIAKKVSETPGQDPFFLILNCYFKLSQLALSALRIDFLATYESNNIIWLSFCADILFRIRSV